jgi:hypothetical protein
MMILYVSQHPFPSSLAFLIVLDFFQMLMKTNRQGKQQTLKEKNKITIQQQPWCTFLGLSSNTFPFVLSNVEVLLCDFQTNLRNGSEYSKQSVDDRNLLQK